MSTKTILAGSVATAALVAGALLWNVEKRKEPGETPVQTASAPPAAPRDALQEKIDEIVGRYRKMIVLLDDEGALSEADRDQTLLAGRIIFQENHQAISELSGELNDDIAKAGDFLAPPTRIGSFLNAIETGSDLHDADKLVFRELLADLSESFAGIRSDVKAKADLEARVSSDRKALAEIQTLYEKELDKIFGRFETRGMPVHREAWERYVAYLHTKYRREDIIKAYEPALGRIGQSGKNGELHRDTDLEIYGNKLPDKTFVLTFDDGPHPRYTDRILEVLKKYSVQSVFFELGENLGSIKNNEIHKTQAAKAATHVLESGSSIGSHSFSHPLLTNLTDRQIATEIDDANRLFESVVNIHPALFRPPYGGRDVRVLAATEAHKMKSVLWNIDSEDWADPVAKSIANRVIGEARKLGHGIILMHDIHERTIDALPLVIETLQSDGYRFLSWDGQKFVENYPLLTQAAYTAPSETAPLYHDSWAVIVGVDNYPKWPKLRYAVNDANAMKDLLEQKFGFKPDHVFTLLNEDATRERILSVLGDTLSNPKTVQREDRVFVFFAGHGATRKLPSGRDLGYIIPYDADAQNFQGQSISMTNFQDISEAIPAKHVLFVMDSCYSGLALTRSGGAPNYIREVSRRTAREMLTAGGADEEVADGGPNGHSVFSWTVLQGLGGRADLNSDGYITASELAAYVGPGVSALAKQTPAFGSLSGSEGGEFVFELHPETEYLSELSAQLDQEAITLNAELDRIRKEVAAKEARNRQLRNDLAAVKSQQAKLSADSSAGASAVSGSSATAAPKTAWQHLNRGNALFQEKRYQEALDEFLAASKLDPKSALAANNVGFVYYKLNNFDEAVKWDQKAIALDPRRSVAYVNIGDLYYNLNRLADARPYYQKYLELEPHSSYATTVRTRLGE